MKHSHAAYNLVRKMEGKRDWEKRMILTFQQLKITSAPCMVQPSPCSAFNPWNRWGLGRRKTGVYSMVLFIFIYSRGRPFLCSTISDSKYSRKKQGRYPQRHVMWTNQSQAHVSVTYDATCPRCFCVASEQGRSHGGAWVGPPKKNIEKKRKKKVFNHFYPSILFCGRGFCRK